MRKDDPFVSDVHDLFTLLQILAVLLTVDLRLDKKDLDVDPLAVLLGQDTNAGVGTRDSHSSGNRGQLQRLLPPSGSVGHGSLVGSHCASPLQFGPYFGWFGLVQRPLHVLPHLCL